MPARTNDITNIMEKFFPLQLAESWDNAGLQLGSLHAPVSRVLIALDVDQEVMQFARQERVELIITHHPLIFNSLKSVDFDSPTGRLLKELIDADITVYSAHTNLDAAERGLSQVLAERVGLEDIRPLDAHRAENLMKLVVYVPYEHEPAVRKAVLDAGAGHIGQYRDCSYRSMGTGTFRPLAGSRPFLGQEGILEEVAEIRLETVLPAAMSGQVVQAMLNAHPYEEVAYDLYNLANPGPIYSLGRAGQLGTAVTLADFSRQVKSRLGLDYVQVVGDQGRMVRKIAVVSGSGASFISKASEQNCDVLVTGDLKYHEARLALELGLAVVDAGHQGTEQIVAEYVRDLLAAETQAMDLNIDLLVWQGAPCISIL